MIDGKFETEEKAELYLQLIDMNFTEDDSIHAANECSSLCSALSFLQQECDLCAGKFSARQVCKPEHHKVNCTTNIAP